ncbi:MAG: hypothetical protein UX37_C0018G0001, partial [Microgenomates group bacterium GW2011_GWA2_46_16]
CRHDIPPPFCVFKLNLLMGYFTEGGAFRFRTKEARVALRPWSQSEALGPSRVSEANHGARESQNQVGCPSESSTR